MTMKRNLEQTNIIALEALEEQLDQYSASVMLGTREEVDGDGEQVP